jgi:hypothetical protein
MKTLRLSTWHTPKCGGDQYTNPHDWCIMALNWSDPGEIGSKAGWQDPQERKVQPGRIFALERDPGVGQGPGRSL